MFHHAVISQNILGHFCPFQLLCCIVCRACYRRSWIKWSCINLVCTAWKVKKRGQIKCVGFAYLLQGMAFYRRLGICNNIMFCRTYGLHLFVRCSFLYDKTCSLLFITLAVWILSVYQPLFDVVGSAELVVVSGNWVFPILNLKLD